jgi:hypothetical protein
MSDKFDQFDEMTALLAQRLRAAHEFRDTMVGLDPGAIVEASEAASVFGYAAEDLDALLDSGELPSSMIGGHRVIRVSNVKAGIDAQTERLAEYARQSRRTSSTFDEDSRRIGGNGVGQAW